LSARESRTNGGSISEGGLLPPMEAIERIEVVRGPMSSLYGSDAMGGVVNVLTRAIAPTWSGSVRANGTMPAGRKYGAFGDANFYVSGPLVKGLGLQLQGSLNRREEDAIRGGTPERKDETLAAKLGFEISPAHRLLIEGGYYRQKTVTTMGKSDIGTPTAAEPLGTRSAMTQTRRVGSITHIGDWGFATSNSYLQYGLCALFGHRFTVATTTASVSGVVQSGWPSRRSIFVNRTGNILRSPLQKGRHDGRP
jgi:outer membrane receptor for ferrienterochelin and colicins